MEENNDFLNCIGNYFKRLESKLSLLESKVTNLETQLSLSCDELKWNQNSFKKEFKGDMVYFTLGVENNKGRKVLYKSETEDWKDSPLIFNSSNKCENIWFKVEGCDKEFWGCIIPSIESETKFITGCS
jgi:hypothetical protein